MVKLQPPRKGNRLKKEISASGTKIGEFMGRLYHLSDVWSCVRGKVNCVLRLYNFMAENVVVVEIQDLKY